MKLTEIDIKPINGGTHYMVNFDDGFQADIKAGTVMR
jgi:hypothetical protein